MVFMHDLRWDDVKDWFNPYENGSVPDVSVPDTTLDDWETLLKLIRSQGWPCEYDYRDQRHPLHASAPELFVPDPERRIRTLWVWPDPNLEWIVRPWVPSEIVGDVNLFEIQGQERLDVFCLLLRTLGTALGKRVLVHGEGTDDYPPMMAYEVDDDRVVFLAGPWR